MCTWPHIFVRPLRAALDWRSSWQASERSVLEVVLDSDVERVQLIREAREIAEREAARGGGGDGAGVSSEADNEQALADTKRQAEVRRWQWCACARACGTRVLWGVPGLYAIELSLVFVQLRHLRS
jgi:hypothetical protein